MIKDKKGKYFSKGKIIKTATQAMVNLPHIDWKHFDKGDQVVIMKATSEGFTTSVVRLVASGNQKMASIYKNQADLFEHKEDVKVYNLKHNK